MEKHKHGGDIYSREIEMDYSANISPLGLPRRSVEAIRASLERLVHYPDVECRSLRAMLSEKTGIPADFILCGNGAAELIFALANGCRPKKALVAAPGFAEYEQALSGCGCEVSFYELKEENGFAYQEDYLQKITEELDMVFLCNPNNPTGGTVDRPFLLAVAERCQACGCILVVDECFNQFLDQAECFTMKPYLEQYPDLVILDAFTKIYAMPGLRLGYCMTANESIRKNLRSVMQPWSVSTLAQVAGEAALEEEFYVDEVRTVIREERGFLEHEMRKMGLTVFPARANFIFFKGPEDLVERLLEKAILIRDCSNYRGLKKGYFRIAVRGHRENEALMQAFEAVLR